MGIANRLTVLRILLVPVFIIFSVMAYFFCRELWLASAAVLIASGITDMLDGKIARARNEVSDFGKIMDPVADRTTMVMGFLVANWIGILNIWATALVILREFAVSGVRLIANTQKGKIIPAGIFGKIKTVIQFIGLVITFIGYGINFSLLSGVGVTIIYLSVIMAIWSGIDYILKNWSLIRSSAMGGK